MTRRTRREQTTGTDAAIRPRLPDLLMRFGRDTSGATALEYGLIAGLVFLAILGALHLYADRTEAMYKRIGTAVAGATS